MSLAPNLARRQEMIHAAYPDIVIYGIGDTAHQAEASDHNPDAQGIWHAIDIMTETDAANSGAAAVILAWLLSDTTDLQYVIHDDRIYGRNEKNGWKGTPYDPDNPKRDRHTNHIHVSGLHGATGKNAATGTGYSVAAEGYTVKVTLVKFMEANMNVTDADGDALIWRVHAIENLLPTIAGGKQKGQPVPFVVAFKKLEADVASIAKAVAAPPVKP